MKDQKNKTQSNTEEHGQIAVYDTDGTLCLSFLQRVIDAVSAYDHEELKKIICNLHQAELGDLLEALQPSQRHSLIDLLDEQFNFSALTEIDPAIALEIVENLPLERVISAVQEIDSDDAVYILGSLEPEYQEKILEKIPSSSRMRLRRSLDYPEESAGRLMQTEFISARPSWTVSYTIDYIRKNSNLPERFNRIFVIDQGSRLVGAVDLDQILRTAPSVSISEIMDDSQRAIPADLDQEEAAREFQKYDLLSAAVLDSEGRLVGVLTIDDVVDVIQEAASEDLLRMGGVRDEQLSDSILKTSRSRVTWLLVNLITAFLAAFVIGLFDQTIEKMVALAVLMPVVAGMGGNAGSQTMTVTVRALANRDIDLYNAGRIIRREIGVGGLNGLIFAILMSLVAAFWFQSPDLGGIIAAAIIISMVAAAGAGILIPLFLNRLGIDPALASSVFVTMVTDIVGFLSFLGLARWWFG